MNVAREGLRRGLNRKETSVRRSLGTCREITKFLKRMLPVDFGEYGLRYVTRVS